MAATDSETRVKEKAETLVKLQTDALAQRQASASAASTTAGSMAAPPPGPAPTTMAPVTGAAAAAAVAEQSARLADRLLRLFLGGADSVPPPAAAAASGCGDLLLPRSMLGEAARIKLLEWGMREGPEAMVGAGREALCLKAALQTLGGRSEEGASIRALGARLAAFLAARCPGPTFALAGLLLLAATKKVLVASYQSLLMSRSAGGGGRGGGGGGPGSALDREAGVREGCYETIAALAHRMGGGIGATASKPQPQLLFSDPLLLRLLFEALAAEGPVQSIKVAEALGALRTAYQPARAALGGRAPVEAAQLASLLSQAAAHSQARARLAAVEWAGTALAPTDVQPWGLCLQLADDPVLAVRRAALHGLGGPFAPLAPGGEEDLPEFLEALPALALPAPASSDGDGYAALLPPFPALAAALLPSSSSASASGADDSGRYPLGGMGVRGQARALHLLWCARLAGTATTTTTATPGGQEPPQPQPQPCPTAAAAAALTELVAWLRTQGLGDPVHARADGRLLYRAAASCLAALAGPAPGGLGAALLQSHLLPAADLRWAQGWLGHEDAAVGEAVALLLGRLRPYMGAQPLTTALYALSGDVDRAVERRDPRPARGPLLALGHMLRRLSPAEEAAAAVPIPPASLVAASAAARAAQSPVNDLHAAACLSLGLMAPPPLLLPGEEGANPTLPPGVRTLASVVDALVADVKGSGGGNHKERRGEAAAGCLAALARGSGGALPGREAALEACLGAGGVRDDELQFALGQALAGLAAASAKARAAVLTKLVEEKAKDHSPHVKAAAAVWLHVFLYEAWLATTAAGGKQDSSDASGGSRPSPPALSAAQLLQAQEALVGLLREKSELAQEASGKGLGVIHALAHEHHQALVDGLVLLLRGPKATAERTQLELNVPSAAASAPTHVDIGSSNPYRELCVLATDLGHPSLIYHFLALPTSHAAWAGRRASGYATPPAATAAELHKALEPLMAKLLPRLYRSRFDPAMAVRQAMEPLWRAVASPDAKAAVKAHFPAILQELVESTGSRKWRERQAAAAGLADL